MKHLTFVVILVIVFIIVLVKANNQSRAMNELNQTGKVIIKRTHPDTIRLFYHDNDSIFSKKEINNLTVLEKKGYVVSIR